MDEKRFGVVEVLKDTISMGILCHRGSLNATWPGRRS